MQLANPCVRCGRERILNKVWTETVAQYSAPVTFSSWICPNEECQLAVSTDIKQKKEKAEALKRDIEEKALARKANRANPVSRPS